MSLALSARAGAGTSVAITGFTLGGAPRRSRRRRLRRALRLPDSRACPPPATPPVAALTPRETEVLALVQQRLTNAEIADRLFVSVRTVETHVSALLRKLGAGDRRALARARRRRRRSTVDRRARCRSR